MHLIIKVGTADKLTAVGNIFLFVQKCQWVCCRQLVVSVGPICIIVVACLGPYEVAVEVFKRLVCKITERFITLCINGFLGMETRSECIRALRRVHIDGGSHCTPFGKTAVGIHSLTVQVDVQVVIQERRTQVERCRKALEVRCFQNTLLVSIAYRHAIWQRVADSSRHGDAVILTEGRAVYEVLPVGIRRTESAVSLRIFAPFFFNECTETVSIQYVDGVFLHTYRHTAVVRNLNAALVPFLGGDDNNAIRAAATVDSCCRCVFQDVETLNILRIDCRENVCHSLYTCVVNRHVVDDNQRVVAGVQRRTATYSDI